jgi:hypothetical protein
MERAAFMRGNFGLMTHWLHTPVGRPAAGAGPSGLSEQVDEWNSRVESFDVKRLAGQLARAGASWFVLTLGQNSGFYCSPNPVYDELVGYPLSKCSKRDLFYDLALELKEHGIKTIAYLPSGAPEYDLQAVEKLRWKDGAMFDENGNYIRVENGFRKYDKSHRLESFQKMWENIIRQWADTWGDLCAGWWVDGCYYTEGMYKTDAEPNFKSLARALRSGNPNAALAFNPGIIRMNAPLVQSDEEDYTSGEYNAFLPISFGGKTGKIGKAQLHILNFLGSNWGQGDAPRLPDDLTISWTRYILDNGGAVTWDIPTSATGEVPVRFIDTLAKL